MLHIYIENASRKRWFPCVACRLSPTCTTRYRVCVSLCVARGDRRLSDVSVLTADSRLYFCLQFLRLHVIHCTAPIALKTYMYEQFSSGFVLICKEITHSTTYTHCQSEFCLDDWQSMPRSFQWPLLARNRKQTFRLQEHRHDAINRL